MFSIVARRGLALFMVVAFAACAARVPYDPFKVPRERVLGRIKTVALVPVILPPEIVDTEVVQSALTAMIEARMQAGGFTTIAPKVFDARWNAASMEAGGLFDPVTGKRDSEKVKAVREKVIRSLQSDLGAEAILTVGVVRVIAGFGSGLAQWDGVEQEMQPNAFLAAVLRGNSTGTVGALSLVARLDDMESVELYRNAGGIQVTSTLSFGGAFEAVPAGELMKDAQRNQNAVNLALGQLTGFSMPTPTPWNPRATPTSHP